MADMLLADIERATKALTKFAAPVHTGGEAEGFHH
jgi:hypothetical protein